jgi:threonine dehydratase
MKRGVICASAGNHAQGVALSAKKLGCRAVIVMPTSTPGIKIAVRSRGGEVVLHGDSFDEAYPRRRTGKTEKLTFVHPFDDPEVIAGQGTMAMEILRQHSRHGPITAVFCAIGGGGLRLAWPPTSSACARKSRSSASKRCRRDEAIAGGRQARPPRAGRPVFRRHRRQAVGEETFRLCKEYLDEVILVDTDAICARSRTFRGHPLDSRAGRRAGRGRRQEYARQHKLKDKNLIAVTSGANMNFDRLRFVAERAEFGEQREAVFAVTLPEKPAPTKIPVADRQAQRHRIQLPLPHRQRSPRLRRRPGQ